MNCQHHTMQLLGYVPCSKEYTPGGAITGVIQLSTCVDCGALTGSVGKEPKAQAEETTEGWMVERPHFQHRHYIVKGKALCGTKLSYVGELRPRSPFAFKTDEECRSCWNLSRGR